MFCGNDCLGRTFQTQGLCGEEKVVLVNQSKCRHTYLISEISLEISLDRTEKSETRNKTISKHICSRSPQGSLESVKDKSLSVGNKVVPLLLSGDCCS